eukprot:GHVH01016710.1.p2 GENE.GHVH01016710.1~~GHVH01016710.1.p2  ORF type:complete len:212 (-),score=25.83 GHVH01016710.1:906-1541(-)
MARKLHPDKNPDNPDAEVQFDLLQQSYEWLLVSGNREDYLRALVKDQATRLRHEQRSKHKNDLASSLAFRERQAADARASMGSKGEGSFNAKRYTQWSDRYEEKARKEASQGDDLNAYNLIKRLKKEPGLFGTVGSERMKDTFDPKNIAKDTWTTLGTGTERNEEPMNSNRINFKGKWRDSQFVKNTIAGSKDIFLQYEQVSCLNPMSGHL